jgi:hypothetical protein
LLTGFAIYELKPGQIRPLYLEPRLACISNLLNKKSITTGHVWQSHYIQNKQKMFGGNIELKTSSDQWKLFKGDDVDSIFVTDCLFTSPSSKPFTHFES